MVKPGAKPKQGSLPRLLPTDQKPDLKEEMRLSQAADWRPSPRPYRLTPDYEGDGALCETSHQPKLVAQAGRGGRRTAWALLSLSLPFACHRASPSCCPRGDEGSSRRAIGARYYPLARIRTAQGKGTMEALG